MWKQEYWVGILSRSLACGESILFLHIKYDTIWRLFVDGLYQVKEILF